MFSSALISAAGFLSLASATPISVRSPPSGSAKDFSTPFYLVASTSLNNPYPNTQTSWEGVQALSLYDPMYTNFPLLRT